jgi:hypothetical protein
MSCCKLNLHLEVALKIREEVLFIGRTRAVVLVIHSVEKDKWIKLEAYRLLRKSI